MNKTLRNRVIRAVSALEILLGELLALFHVEAAVVDRPAARRRARILAEEHEPAGLGRELLLVVRVGVEEHRARSAHLPADAELAFEDVPDLREVVPVQRV